MPCAAYLPTIPRGYSPRVTWLLDRLGQIGADPIDDLETRGRKALLVYLAALILPISLVWGTLYLTLGAVSGLVAFAYFAISVASIGLFARTRNFELLLRIQLLDITLAPTLSMWPTAGFLASGAVGLWGLLGPMGALVFGSVRSSIRWFVVFAVAFLASGILGELSGGRPGCRLVQTTMIALNVAVGGAVVFTLLVVLRQAGQSTPQDVAENLLLNILPRSIADKLKAEPETIADSSRLDPVRGRGRVHAIGGAAVRHARWWRCSTNLFGHFDTPGRALRPGEDQDHRRLLHGRGRHPVAAPGPRPHPGLGGAGHAGGRATPEEPWATWASSCGLASTPGRWSRASSAASDSSTTYGATRSTPPAGCRSQSTPGRIQITRATYELLKDEFVCEPRGTIPVKGKGDMETWYLIGRR